MMQMQRAPKNKANQPKAVGKRWALSAALLALTTIVGFAAPAPCRADTMQYNVNFGPSFGTGLGVGSTNFALDFFLAAGDPGAATSPNPLNNANVTGSNFNFGGGSGPGTVAVSDTGAFNETQSPFVVGNTLSFLLTTNFTPNAANPDQFSFSLFNTATSTNTDTAAPDGVSYFTITFDNGTPTVATFAGTNPAIAAPTVTAVPEPGTCALMLLGLSGLAANARKRRKGSSSESVDALNPASC